MKEIKEKYTKSIFKNIKHVDEYDNEFWYARKLQTVLEYKDWKNFQKVIDKAKGACQNSKFNLDEQLLRSTVVKKK